MGLKKMFKNGDAKGSVRRRRGAGGKESGKDDMDTDDEVENNCEKVSDIVGSFYWPSQSVILLSFITIPSPFLLTR